MRRFSLLRGQDGQLVDLQTIQNHLACVSQDPPAAWGRLPRALTLCFSIVCYTGYNDRLGA
jgi:hypothetical protein